MLRAPFAYVVWIIFYGIGTTYLRVYKGDNQGIHTARGNPVESLYENKNITNTSVSEDT